MMLSNKIVQSVNEVLQKVEDVSSNLMSFSDFLKFNRQNEMLNVLKEKLPVRRGLRGHVVCERKMPSWAEIGFKSYPSPVPEAAKVPQCNFSSGGCGGAVFFSER